MARLVEVFTAGCPLCDQIVKLVRELACHKEQQPDYPEREPSLARAGT